MKKYSQLMKSPYSLTTEPYDRAGFREAWLEKVSQLHSRNIEFPPKLPNSVQNARPKPKRNFFDCCARPELEEENLKKYREEDKSIIRDYVLKACHENIEKKSTNSSDPVEHNEEPTFYWNRPTTAVKKTRPKTDSQNPKPVYFYFSTDVNKPVLTDNFHKRGWREVSGFDCTWNLYWAGLLTCKNIFSMDYKYRLRDNQIINHFPTSVELSRKDLLVKNIKRYRKDLERHNNPLAVKHPSSTALDIGGTRYIHLNIIPMTFVLPADYNLFLEEYKKTPNSTWIMKPCGKSQGAGIFLVRSLKQLKKWAYDSRTFYMPHFNRETYVISKYIDSPLLIGGKKFDLRLYVLVTTFNPLKAYLYKEGFCRFCTQKYNTEINDLENLYVHLTNVSIQKNNEEYNSNHGGKWSLQNFLLYMESTRGIEVTQTLFSSIVDVIEHALRAVAPVMANDRHCFEVYGYDIIIDGKLKPWLIEINSCPSIHATTPMDLALKTRLIDNVLKVVIPPNGMPDARWSKTPSAETIEAFIPLTRESVPDYKPPLAKSYVRKPAAIAKPITEMLSKNLLREKYHNITH